MTNTIESKIRIDAPREQVWKVLADIEGIPTWAPIIKHAKVEGEPGEGAVRHCTFPDGGHIDERFVAWEEPALQRYEITGDVPFSGVVSEWALAEDSGGTVVVYRATFDEANEVPAEVAAEFGGMAEVLLASLKSYVETGKVLEPPKQ